MSNARTLARKVDALKSRIAPKRAAKTWVLVLEPGDPIPAHLPILAHDTVVRREVPTGYLGVLKA